MRNRVPVKNYVTSDPLSQSWRIANATSVTSKLSLAALAQPGRSGHASLRAAPAALHASVAALGAETEERVRRA